MTDNLNKKCKISFNKTLGRFIQAEDDLNCGETILIEQPILILASNGEKRCSNCFKLAVDYCQKCKISPLCSNCKEHNEFDCTKLSSLKELRHNELNASNEAYNIVKCLLLHENEQTEKYFYELLQAECHLEERRQNVQLWAEYQKTVVEPIMKSGLPEQLKYGKEINEASLQRLCAVIDVNGFEIRSPDSGSMTGVYIKGAILSHDCMANTVIAVDDSYCMKIYSNRSIKCGEKVTNCYTDVLQGTTERRKMLMEGKYFHCLCLRCEDPTEMGTHMSTVKCFKCKNGFMIENFQTAQWQCLSCKNFQCNQEVLKFMTSLKTEVSSAKESGNLKEMEFCLIKLSKVLHSNHFLILDVKQNIAANLREILNNISLCPGRAVYERKIDLCKDILKILDMILPGISRLKAIALYELATALAEYNRMLYRMKELAKMDLKELLKEPELLLRDSIRMLLYEPKDSPEGQLVQSMMQELKYLQNDIKMLK